MHTEQYIDDSSCKRVKYYQDKWHEEIGHWKEMKLFVEDLDSNVESIQSDITELKQTLNQIGEGIAYYLYSVS